MPYAYICHCHTCTDIPRMDLDARAEEGSPLTHDRYVQLCMLMKTHISTFHTRAYLCGPLPCKKACMRRLNMLAGQKFLEFPLRAGSNEAFTVRGSSFGLSPTCVSTIEV